jgi:hypothetical protein
MDEDTLNLPITKVLEISSKEDELIPQIGCLMRWTM